jgi:WD40 repeat protein
MAVTFSPDGKTLVAGCPDHQVRLWDVGQGVAVRTLTGHTGQVYSVAVSPDGKTVASGSTDKTIRLWDAATGEERLKLEGHRDRVLGLAFSPDGKRLASCGWDVTVRLWDTATGAELSQRRGVQWDNWICRVAFTPEGKSLVTSGHHDGAVRVWDAATLKETRRFEARQRDDAVLALSADGKLLATGGVNTVVRLWDFATGRERLTGRGPESSLEAVAFSPDGRTLATGGHNEPITLWKLADGRSRRAGDGKRIETRFIVFSPDGKGLVSADIAVNLHQWDAATDKELRTLRGPESHLLAACFTEGGLLAAGAHADHIDLWEVRTDRRRRLTHAGTKPTIISYLALSPDGKTLASSGGGMLRFWDTASGKETASLATSAGELTFAPDGRTLAFSDYASVRLWDVAARKIVRTLPGDNDAVRAIAFSPDGRLVGSAGHDPRVNLWEVATGRLVRCFTGHAGWVNALAFSPDGRMLASAGRDTTALLWDVTGRVKGGKLVAANPTPAELEALWTALRDEEAARAFPALWALVAAPKQTVPFLGGRLPAAAAADRRIPQWIADLDDNRFPVREKAMKGLAEQGARAALPLRQALKGGLTEEARRRIEALLAKAPGTVSDGLAVMRALHVLEQIGTPEARAVLREVAEAGGETPAGREARASLSRLEKRRGRR